MKVYTVYLFYSPDCVRKWLAYREPKSRATVVVRIPGGSGQRAKNAAITAANNYFQGVEIIHENYEDPLWGIAQFPELMAFFSPEYLQ